MQEQHRWVCHGGPLAGALVEVDGMVNLARRISLAELGRGRLSFSYRGYYQPAERPTTAPHLTPRQFLRWVPEPMPDGALVEQSRARRPTGIRHFLFEGDLS